MRRDRSGQVRRAAGARDQDLDAAGAGLADVFGEPGVRWAESTRDSCATPNRASVSPQWRMVSQSERLPMSTATRGREGSCIRGGILSSGC